MLTDNEREWLRLRDFFPFNSCLHCEHSADFIISRMCPFLRDKNCIDLRTMNFAQTMKDAAEFSERVAAKLAENDWGNIDEDCPPNMAFGWGKLKHARLAVEEEMDA